MKIPPYLRPDFVTSHLSFPCKIADVKIDALIDWYWIVLLALALWDALETLTLLPHPLILPCVLVARRLEGAFAANMLQKLSRDPRILVPQKVKDVSLHNFVLLHYAIDPRHAHHRQSKAWGRKLATESLAWWCEIGSVEKSTVHRAITTSSTAWPDWFQA